MKNKAKKKQTNDRLKTKCKSLKLESNDNIINT